MDLYQTDKKPEITLRKEQAEDYEVTQDQKHL